MDNKDHITRFIQGECSQQEQDFILQEAEFNPEFKQVLLELKNIYVHENMPDNQATDAEYVDFKKYAMQRMLLEESESRAEKDEQNIVAKKRDLYRIVSRITSWSIAAVIVVLLALNLKYHYHNEIVADKEVDSSAYIAQTPIAESTIEPTNTLYTAKGIKGEVVLPDGSKVTLNSDSRISYPANFTGATRDVEFSGEGYFQVEKDSLHPMVISCNNDFKVIVYGTTFNLKTYSNDNSARTTLISGAIKIVENVNGKEFVRDVAPNQTYTIEKNKQLATLQQEPDTDKVCEWKDGILSFDSTPLCEVVKILERWHGLQIVVESKNKENIPITARFTTESIVHIMDLLKFSTEIDYTILDNIVTIR